MKVKIPTLLIKKSKCLANLKMMSDKALANKIEFRPHFKTHQSSVVGKWFMEAGIKKITVSSLSMAVKFAQQGWDDITIAFPPNPMEMPETNNLASRIKLNLIVDSLDSFQHVIRHIKKKIGIYIEIDAGYQRSGIPSVALYDIADIIKALQKTDYEFKGLLSHFGNTYQATNKDTIKRLYQYSLDELLNIKSYFYEEHEIEIPEISIGDTPSCSVIDDFTGVNEIRPGNFIYYDLMQMQIGSCQFHQISVVVACPIVSIRIERDEMVVYGGAIHLSKEFLADRNDYRHYGLVVDLYDNEWSEPIKDAKVISLSQEHGVIKMPRNELRRFKVGDCIGIVPVHSCLTANQLLNSIKII